MSGNSPFSPEQFRTRAYQQKEAFIFITVLQIIAILSTIFRLVRRIRIKKLSWDDGWAVGATLLCMGFVILGWVSYALAIKRLGKESMLEQPELGTTEILIAVLELAAIWASRISLSLSIWRILPKGRLKTVALAFSIGCFLVGSTIMTYHAVMLYSLRSETQWPAWRRWKVAGPQVIADILCSLFLVALPLYALSKMTSLPSSERRIILILFAGTLLSLGAGCGEVAATVVANVIGLVYGATVQAAVGLMVCNSLVIVTALLRLASRRRTLRSHHGAEVTIEGQTTHSDEQEYNSGEDPISLGGTRSTAQRMANTAWLSPESQLTEFGETQTYSYIMGSLPGGSEERAETSNSAFSHERNKRGS
ncbi:hypothetical protein AAF712_014572 [Marasmius tenuissimus]|uniref:Integral membrane protein n=1 Tax=Marasmius tenuissimus TaxID=585030 RepID=A0ABR2ZC02_9AGAR